MQYEFSSSADRSGTPASGLAWMLQTIRTTWERWQRMRRKQRTVRILRGLSDRTLKDIGVDRSRIESIVHGCGEDRRMRCSSRDFYLT